jgi:hypothetical protein
MPIVVLRLLQTRCSDRLCAWRLSRPTINWTFRLSAASGKIGNWRSTTLISPLISKEERQVSEEWTRDDCNCTAVFRTAWNRPGSRLQVRFGSAIPLRSSTIQLNRIQKWGFRFDWSIRKNSSLNCIGKRICSSHEPISTPNLY